MSDTHQVTAPSALVPILEANYISRLPYDDIRAKAQASMVHIAEAMPVWPWCGQVYGFAALGLAVLVAEAGNDLSAYPTHSHLWKRLGLAPYRGRAMSSWGKKDLTKDEWIEQGYSAPRRGRIAGDIGKSLFLGKAHHRYGEVYAARRARTAVTHPEWTKDHSDKDARRIMLKALVRDIWRWWREAEGARLKLQATVTVPPSLLEAAE